MDSANENGNNNNGTCDRYGRCFCDWLFTGDKCDNCELGYYDADGNESDSTTNCKGNSFICV